MSHVRFLSLSLSLMYCFSPRASFNQTQRYVSPPPLSLPPVSLPIQFSFSVSLSHISSTQGQTQSEAERLSHTYIHSLLIVSPCPSLPPTPPSLSLTVSLSFSLTPGRTQSKAKRPQTLEPTQTSPCRALLV